MFRDGEARLRVSPGAPTSSSPTSSVIDSDDCCKAQQNLFCPFQWRETKQELSKRIEQRALCFPYSKHKGK